MSRWCIYECKCGKYWQQCEEAETIITAFIRPKRRCPDCGRMVKGKNEPVNPSPWEGVGGY